jgi:hypothetical protein
MWRFSARSIVYRSEAVHRGFIPGSPRIHVPLPQVLLRQSPFCLFSYCFADKVRIHLLRLLILWFYLFVGYVIPIYQLTRPKKKHFFYDLGFGDRWYTWLSDEFFVGVKWFTDIVLNICHTHAQTRAPACAHTHTQLHFESVCRWLY